MKWLHLQTQAQECDPSYKFSSACGFGILCTLEKIQQNQKECVVLTSRAYEYSIGII
jgi:hypothetical protein